MRRLQARPAAVSREDRRQQAAARRWADADARRAGQRYDKDGRHADEFWRAAIRREEAFTRLPAGDADVALRLDAELARALQALIESL